MTSEIFPGRLGLQQRVIPTYRAAFLDLLAGSCQAGLSVLAGQPLPIEGIEPVNQLQTAQLVKISNRYFRDPSSSLFVCWQPGFLEWLESWQPDVLIVEANPRYPTTRQAIRWMHARGRKVIGWGLGAPAITGSLAGFRARERIRLLHSLDAIIAYSRQGAEQYRQLGLPSERVYVACNAVDPAPKSPPPLRSINADSQPNLLFVGRLQRRKRIDLLLRACASLPKELQPHLVIVGDGPEKATLVELATQLYPGAEFPGARHGEELIPYYAQADLFVLPGSGGLAIQQAMAQGLPVVVALGDGTQDDLVRQENGWQVPPGDLPALTNVLQQALSDRTRLRQMGMVSYRIVVEEINIEAMVRVFIDVLNTLFDSKSTSSAG
jgi:glycosyltransferase involved in cell wall biosynthesis